MSWYGWIPILTNSLYPNKHIKDLMERSELIKDSHFLIPSKSEFPDFRDKIEEVKTVIPIKDNNPLLFRFISTDYLTPSYSLLNIILIDNVGIIKKIYLIDEDYMVLGVADIDFIRPNSLVKFHFYYISDLIDETTIARIIYSTIRDTYHEHIFAKQADLSLYPFQTDCENDAIHNLAQQYQFKIIDYHQKIIHHMDKLEKSKNSITTLRNLRNIMLRIEQAKGELSFADNFHKLFYLDVYLSSIQSANNSLDTIQNKIAYLLSIEGTASNLTMTFLTVFIVFLTIFSVSREALNNNFKWQTIVSFSFSIIALFILQFIRWYTLKSKE